MSCWSSSGERPLSQCGPRNSSMYSDVTFCVFMNSFRSVRLFQSFNDTTNERTSSGHQFWLSFTFWFSFGRPPLSYFPLVVLFCSFKGPAVRLGIHQHLESAVVLAVEGHALCAGVLER